MNTQPLVYTIAEALKVAAVGRTELYRAVNRGELVMRKRGKRSLILADDLKRWVETMPAATHLIKAAAP